MSSTERPRQRELLRARKLFDAVFLFRGGRTSAKLFGVHQRDRPARAGIASAVGGGVVFAHSPREIRGDAGVESLVGALEDVEVVHDSIIIAMLTMPA